MKDKKEWFTTWFDTTYYNQLYQKRSHQEAIEFIQNVVTKIPIVSDTSFIDVGCGNGRHALAFSQFISYVVGLDISPNKIKEANAHRNARTSFFVHDMRKPFIHHQVDIVCNVFTSFGYCANEKENDCFFNNMCALIKPQGYFILDYLNTAAFLKSPESKETITVENTHFTINKFQDENFFYKKIELEDLLLQQQYVFQEAVRKYSREDFLQKINNNKLTVLYQFGNYALDTYIPQSSPRLILIAQKHK